MKLILRSKSSHLGRCEGNISGDYQVTRRAYYFCVVRRNSLNLISFLQRDIILQHEIHQLNEYDFIVDAMKTSLDNSLIGRWISISWHRQQETLGFFAFDVGMVTDVKERNVFVDYKDEGVHAVPLKASGWNRSTNGIPRRQHRWRMLAKKYTKTEATNKSMGI